METIVNAEPLKYEELEEGKDYDIYCVAFDVSNKVRLVSFDTTHLKRKIAYFQFIGMGDNLINKRQLTIMFMKDKCPNNLFALWNFDLTPDRNIITKL